MSSCDLTQSLGSCILTFKRDKKAEINKKVYGKWINSAAPACKRDCACRLGLDDVVTQETGEYGGIWRANVSLGEDHGTSHISVVDKNRMAVAMTTSINTNFGSKAYSRSTGGATSQNHSPPGAACSEMKHYYCRSCSHCVCALDRCLLDHLTIIVAWAAKLGALWSA